MQVLYILIVDTGQHQRAIPGISRQLTILPISWITTCMFYIQRESFVGAKVKLQSTTWALVLKAIWQSVFLQFNVFGILVLRTQHK